MPGRQKDRTLKPFKTHMVILIPSQSWLVLSFSLKAKIRPETSLSVDPKHGMIWFPQGQQVSPKDGWAIQWSGSDHASRVETSTYRTVELNWAFSILQVNVTKSMGVQQHCFGMNLQASPRGLLNQKLWGVGSRCLQALHVLKDHLGENKGQGASQLAQ